MPAPSASAGLVDAARALGTPIRVAADEIERERRLPAALVQALKDAGLLHMALPRELGGSEADPLTVLRVVEELSRADGSVGWCALIAYQNHYFAALLPEQAAREVFRDPRAVVAGSLPPRGRAVACEGGYRVSGTWIAASGILHADWVFANAPIYDGETPRLDTGGVPVTRLLFTRPEHCTVLDTWTTTGLRGTGSHDFELHDVLVPEPFAGDLNAAPWHPSLLHRCPTLICPLHGAQALGIAQAALDEVIALAPTKVPARQVRPLCEQAWFQAQLARAEALVGSARSFLQEATGALWETVAAGEESTALPRARVLLAEVHAAWSAVQATELLYAAGGATAIYARSRLDRAFRDVHTAVAHRQVSPPIWEAAGRVSLGLEPGVPFF
jgi:alkylation response protein AidB-like acyl-CoA dehydrogenase